MGGLEKKERETAEDKELECILNGMELQGTVAAWHPQWDGRSKDRDRRQWVLLVSPIIGELEVEGAKMHESVAASCVLG